MNRLAYTPLLLTLVFCAGFVPAVQAADPPLSFILEWGSRGTEGGEFNDPAAIAITPSGDLYIADQKNNRIQRFTADGLFVSTFGEAGRNDGQFDHAIGVALDSNGNVYVADWGNNRVQKFQSDGTFISTFGSLGAGDGQFNGPVGLAVDGADFVYVADQFNNRIQKFQSDGTFAGKWGTTGGGEGQFDFPRYVTVDHNDVVHVSDFHDRVQKFTSSGDFIMQFGSSGSSDGQLKSPLGLAVDQKSRVYVADSNNHRIQKFLSDGRFFWQMGNEEAGAPAPGDDPGEFDGPLDVKVGPDGSVYVADTRNQRIQKFALTEVAVPEGSEGSPVLGLFASSSLRSHLQQVVYDLPEPARVSLWVFDAAGRPVQELLNAAAPAGRHRTEWNAGGLPSGVYFYHLQAGSQAKSKKIVLVH